MTKNKSTLNLKFLPLVTALCVLVLTAVGCRNVVLQELLRNRNKRTQESTFPEAYYVRDVPTAGDGTAYSTPFNQLIDALDAVQASNGKTNRVIVIGKLTSQNAQRLDGGGGVFPLKNYGTESNPITISGMTGGTLDAETSGKSVMSISNCNLRFENITFTGGNGSNDGGGLNISGNSNVKLYNGARIIDNTVSGRGGGIYIESGNLTIDGAEITKNTATGSSGGGLYAGGNANVTIKSGLFTVNKATGNGGNGMGGGVFILGSASFTMTGGTISANSASAGGGIYTASTGTVKIRGGAITRNTAASGGGGICSDGNWTLDGAKITDNETFMGGGVFVIGGTMTYKSGIISGNTADMGKSIYCPAGSIVVGIAVFLTTPAMGDIEANDDIP